MTALGLVTMLLGRRAQVVGAEGEEGSEGVIVGVCFDAGFRLCVMFDEPAHRGRMLSYDARELRLLDAAPSQDLHEAARRWATDYLPPDGWGAEAWRRDVEPLLSGGGT